MAFTLIYFVIKNRKNGTLLRFIPWANLPSLVFSFFDAISMPQLFAPLLS
jgi:hypothetical protein